MLQTPKGSFALSLVQFGTLLLKGQSLCERYLVAFSVLSFVKCPNTSANGFLMFVTFAILPRNCHCILLIIIKKPGLICIYILERDEWWLYDDIPRYLLFFQSNARHELPLSARWLNAAVSAFCPKNEPAFFPNAAAVSYL
jgi:hypothetical protein